MTLSPAYVVRQRDGVRELPVIRGWIVDELEARHPVTFAAWVDADAVTTAVEAFGHLWGEVGHE